MQQLRSSAKSSQVVPVSESETRSDCIKSSLVVIISVTCIVKLDHNIVRSHIDCSYSYV
eukprot:COSAG06_NODE_27220_length_597_cov_15.411647_1_plen_59_part_00